MMSVVQRLPRFPACSVALAVAAVAMIAMLIAPARSAADGTITGQARFELIKGQPHMGYQGLYEVNLFVSPRVTDVIGPSRRLGAPPDMTPTGDGFYSVDLPPGTYGLLVSQPLFHIRSAVVPEVVVAEGESQTQNIDLPIEFSTYFRSADQWTGPEGTWYQTFTATGRAVSGVTFVLASAESLSVNVAVLEDDGSGEIADWPMLAESATRAARGADNWVRFRSGEVPIVPGHRYAIRLRSDSSFQPYKRDKDGDSYVGGEAHNASGDAQPFDLTMVVFGDNDGSCVTMSKRRTGVGDLRDGFFDGRWGQTFVAQGTSLAAADIFAAGSTWNLAFTWEIREDGPTGPEIATRRTVRGAFQSGGIGLYGVAYGIDEVPLVRGRTYYVGMTGSEGFNPLIMTDDSYDDGHAHQGDGARPDVDLNMTIMEYGCAEEASLPDGGVPSNPDGGSASDGGPEPDGSAAADAGGSDASIAADGGSGAASGGCSCRMARRIDGPSSLALVAMGSVLLITRLRRRGRRGRAPTPARH